MSTGRLLEFAGQETSPKREKKNAVQQLVEIIMNDTVSKCKLGSEIFRMLYCVWFFCGSFRDDIKICEPDEFDVQLVFSFPNSKIVDDEQFPGCVKGKINPCQGDTALQTFLQHMIDGDNFLRSSKFLSWIESLFDKITWNNRVNGYLLDFCKLRKNGPAFTLGVHIKDVPAESPVEPGFDFKIDIVPGLECQAEAWHSKINYPGTDRNFIAIFKPKNGAGNAENNLLIAAYPKQESEILNNNNQMKPTIRLAKKLRNRKSMGNFKSYFIKVIAMTMTRRNGVSFWDKPLEHTFYKMLQYAEKCFKKRKLLDYWHPEKNLLDKFNANQIDTLRMQTKSAIKDFDSKRNSSHLLKLFFTKSELCSIAKRITIRR